MSVWTPPTAIEPSALVGKLQSPEVAAKLGFDVQAQLLEPSDLTAFELLGEQRRLKLVCPQRPGIVLAITELLKDQGCKMSNVNADTLAKDSEIWFEVEQPASHCLPRAPSHPGASRGESPDLPCVA